MRAVLGPHARAHSHPPCWRRRLSICACGLLLSGPRPARAMPDAVLLFVAQCSWVAGVVPRARVGLTPAGRPSQEDLDAIQSPFAGTMMESCSVTQVGRRACGQPWEAWPEQSCRPAGAVEPARHPALPAAGARETWVCFLFAPALCTCRPSHSQTCSRMQAKTHWTC